MIEVNKEILAGGLEIDKRISRGKQLLQKRLTDEQRSWIKDILPILEDLRIIADKAILGEPLTEQDRQIIELIRPRENL